MGAVFSDVKYKSSKNNVTELDLITIFPSSDFPVTKKEPGLSITTVVSLREAPPPDSFIYSSEKTI